MLRNYLNLLANYNELQKELLLKQCASLILQMNSSFQKLEDEVMKTNNLLRTSVIDCNQFFAKFQQCLNFPEETKLFLAMANYFLELNKKMKSLEKDLDPDTLKEYLDKTSDLNVKFKQLVDQFISTSENHSIEMKQILKKFNEIIRK